MMNDGRLFRRTDPDFPTTKAAQLHLVAAGRVIEEGPFAGQLRASATTRKASLPVPAGPSIPLGETDHGTLHLDLNWLLAGRCLIQGSSGSGKSATLRHVIEEAHDYLTTIIVDPEGEFWNLAEHIGAISLRASELAPEGLTTAALGARHHRIPMHLDLTDLDPDTRVEKAAAFFAGLLASPREDWANTVLVAVDEAHLLAPHVAGSAREVDTKRLGVSTLTDLCARGRKRGISVVISTQRLAKLATSVLSELQNFLLGLNVLDRDVMRAGDLLGFDSNRAGALRSLRPGEFYALGPALSPFPVLVRIAPTVTRHTGTTPEPVGPADVSSEAARALINLDALLELTEGSASKASKKPGFRALDTFLVDPAAAAATRIIAVLLPIAPNATTAADLARHLSLDPQAVTNALDLLAFMGTIDSMARDGTRIARLSARVRLKAQDTAVLTLS